MRRLSSDTALLPISALLLASLMIASLVGIQGAVDSALNVTIAGRSLPDLGFGTSSMSPVFTQRQPAQRASESLAFEASTASTVAVTQSSAAVTPVVPEIASPTDTFLRASLFEDAGSKHAKPKHKWNNKGERKAGYLVSLFTDKGHKVKGDVEKGSTQGKGKKKK